MLKDLKHNHRLHLSVCPSLVIFKNYFKKHNLNTILLGRIQYYLELLAKLNILLFFVFFFNGKFLGCLKIIGKRVEE